MNGNGQQSTPRPCPVNTKEPNSYGRNIQCSHDNPIRKSHVQTRYPQRLCHATAVAQYTVYTTCTPYRVSYVPLPTTYHPPPPCRCPMVTSVGINKQCTEGGLIENHWTHRGELRTARALRTHCAHRFCTACNMDPSIPITEIVASVGGPGLDLGRRPRGTGGLVGQTTPIPELCASLWQNSGPIDKWYQNNMVQTPSVRRKPIRRTRVGGGFDQRIPLMMFPVFAPPAPPERRIPNAHDGHTLAVPAKGDGTQSSTCHA